VFFFLIYIALGAIALAGVLLFVYEGLAFVVKGVPSISDIVIAWVMANKFAATIVAAIWLGATAFLLIHFFLGG
jgi:hypothetical protein